MGILLSGATADFFCTGSSELGKKVKVAVALTA
jgi:hypothetical protein